jgi:hypothetical protein
MLLHKHQYDQGLPGSIEDVREFQGRCFPAEIMARDRIVESPFLRTAVSVASPRR